MAVINAQVDESVFTAPTDAVSQRQSPQIDESIFTAPADAVSQRQSPQLGELFAVQDDGTDTTGHYHVYSADSVRVSPFLNAVKAQLVTLAEGVGSNDLPSALLGFVLFDQIMVNDVPSASGNYHITALDVLNVADMLYVGYSVALADGIGVAPTEKIQQAIKVMEALGLSDLIVPAGVYRYTVAEILRLSDSLANFFGATIADGIGINDVVGNTLRSFGLVAEGIGVNDAQTPQLILRVTADEGIGVSPTEALRMLYRQTVTEGIELASAYVSPSGGFTTWAMNTRTGAVTEYSNFAFNSFAAIDGKYLGASSAGLYELDGNTDAGTSIVAKIKSGFAQFAGTHHTLFKAAYLGVRGEGSFVLKVISGEGQEYIYSVSTRNRRSTKVHMGRGLRARYFAFELISAGQDFDLDTIEFVPLVAQRRV